MLINFILCFCIASENYFGLSLVINRKVMGEGECPSLPFWLPHRFVEEMSLPPFCSPPCKAFPPFHSSLAFLSFLNCKTPGQVPCLRPHPPSSRVSGLAPQGPLIVLIRLLIHAADGCSTPSCLVLGLGFLLELCSCLSA